MRLPSLFKKIITFFCLSLLTTSCSFYAIYKERDEASAEVEKISYLPDLEAIRIEKIPTRLGQEIKKNLYAMFNPQNVVVEPKYFLTLKVTQSVGSTYTTITGSSGRNKAHITTNYELKNLSNAKTISLGNTSTSGSYYVTDNRYGSYVAEEDTGSNLAVIIAQNIRNSIVNDFIEWDRCQKDKDAKRKVECQDKAVEEPQESGFPKESEYIKIK